MSDTTPPSTDAVATTPVQEIAPAETFSAEYVQGLRNEAAKYRNDKKDAVQAAKDALNAEWETKLSGSADEVNRLGTDLGDAWVELAKLYAALDAGVPSDKVRDFAGVLKGSDAESIKGSAESAKALFGGFKTDDPATDPTQGSGGSAIPLNGDKLMQALSRAVGL